MSRLGPTKSFQTELISNVAQHHASRDRIAVLRSAGDNGYGSSLCVLIKNRARFSVGGISVLKSGVHSAET